MHVNNDQTDGQDTGDVNKMSIAVVFAVWSEMDAQVDTVHFSGRRGKQ